LSLSIFPSVKIALIGYNLSAHFSVLTPFVMQFLSCLILLSPAFGTSFKMPMIVYVSKPNPEPMSENCNINNTWYV